MALDRKSIERQAAEWLALGRARPLTSTERAAFDAWSALPAHSSAYLEVERAWKRFDGLAAYPRAADQSPDPDLLAPETSKRASILAFPSRVWIAASAALIALSVGIWWVRTQPAMLADRPASFVVMTEQAAPASPPEIGATTQPRLLRLTDGTEVELNSGSVIAERYTPSIRQIRLVKGEAHFTVAKNPNRPFVVNAGTVAVHALGTDFNVRFGRSAIEVLVTEGKVLVATSPATGPDPEAELRSGGENSVYLTASEFTAVPLARSGVGTPGPSVSTLDSASVDRALAWQRSRLSFDSAPLAEAVARFNRYLEGGSDARRLVIKDERVGKVLITGRIRADNLEGFLDVLETNFGIVVVRQGREIVLQSQ